MYYIFNKDNLCICSCSYEPSQKDLDTRQEKFVVDTNVYDISNIKLENGKIVPIPPKQPTLDELKQKKLEELDNEAYQQYIGGFQSDCGTKIATYDSTENDQSNIQTMYNASRSSEFATDPVYKGKIPMHCTPIGAEEKTVYMLDADQMQKLIDDMARHVGAVKIKHWQKQAEVEKATSQTDLDKISMK